MRAGRLGAVLRLVVVLVVGSLSMTCASSDSRSVATNGVTAKDVQKMTQQEVQAELMAFSDRFFAGTLESAKVLESALDTPESRYTAAGSRLVALTVTTDLASSPNPGAAVLDMAVFVTLKRVVWQDYWMPDVYGDAGLPVLAGLLELERDIWGIAAKIYSAEQLAELRGLIDDWRADHPDVIAVDFVRLSEIGDTRAVKSLVDAGSPGGMLAPVKEANRNLEEMRLLAERLVFMSTRMQLMVSLQIEMASAKLALQPEVRRLLEDSTTFTDATDRAAAAFAVLAENLPAERRAAIDQMLHGLSVERERLLADLGADDGNLRGALADVRATLEAGRETAAALDEAIRDLDALFEGTAERNKTANRPFDILDYQETFTEATTTAREVQKALAALARLLGAADGADELAPIIEGANRIEDEVINEVIDRTFVRGVLLILVFFVVLTLYRWLARRLFDGPALRRDGDQ